MKRKIGIVQRFDGARAGHHPRRTDRRPDPLMIQAFWQRRC
jgi:hypothetical protein